MRNVSPGRYAVFNVRNVQRAALLYTQGVQAVCCQKSATVQSQYTAVHVSLPTVRVHSSDFTLSSLQSSVRVYTAVAVYYVVQHLSYTAVHVHNL